MHDVLTMPKGPKFEEAAKAYVAAENVWLEHIGEGTKRLGELAKNAPTKGEADRLTSLHQDIWNLYNGFPVTDEWKAREDIPGKRPSEW